MLITYVPRNWILKNGFDSSDIKDEYLKLYDLILLEEFNASYPLRLKYIWMIKILMILLKPVKLLMII